MTSSDANNFHPDFSLANDTDIILCSSDNRNFATHSVILRNASPFFRDMLSLPPPKNHEDDTSRGPPVLRLDEDAVVVEGLLRMISAMEIPSLSSMDRISPLLHAAEKYDMRGPRSIIRAAILSPQLRGQALEIYALASKYGWNAETEAISAYTHAFDLRSPEAEKALRGATGASVLKLVQLHGIRRNNIIACLLHPEIQDIAEAYPCCGRDDPRWTNLSLRLLLEMQSRCDTELVSDASFLGWPETAAFRDPLCFKCRADTPIQSNGDRRLREMQEAFITILQGSPKTIGEINPKEDCTPVEST
jgi:hypothetical protein